MKALLVDGSAIAYRSHFAFVRNPLYTSRGEPTSLIFGFLNTLWRWLKSYEPEIVAVVFDPPGPTTRHVLDAAYKANRPERPEEMRRQMPRLLEALDTLGIARLQIEGWEADDVLATLARRLERQGTSVYLASSDKDFRQILSERVRIVRPASPAGGRDVEVGPEELRRELGLSPEQIVDAMALSGDATDNVPGVAGIGEKTAAALVREHGSLEAIYDDLEHIERPALRRKLESGRDAAFHARRLVQLDTAAPVDIELEALLWSTPDWQPVRTLLQELELFQILRLVPAPAPLEPLRPQVVRERTAFDSQVEAWRSCERVALHLEPGAEPLPLRALGVSDAPGRAVVVGFEAPAHRARPGELDLRLPETGELDLEAVRPSLAALLEDPKLLKIGHDLKSLARALDTAGLHLEGPRFDTMVAAYVLDASRRQHDLTSVVLEQLDLRLPSDWAAKPGAGLEVAGLRAEAVLQLHDKLAPALVDSDLGRLFEEIEMPLVDVLFDMERTGVCVDVERLRDLSRALGERAEETSRRIFDLCGRSFNLNSTQQVGSVLFGELGLPHGRRSQSGWSTDAAVLEKLAHEHEVVRILLEYRQVTKLRSTYADALPALVRPHTGRIHTVFHQTVASTGRLSSSDPNLQNIPIRSDLGRRIRTAFVPGTGYDRLVSADYSQIELRLMAHLSGDPALVAAFRDGIDVHVATAARIGGCAPEDVTAAQRAAAKTVNFGVLYGMGARGLASRLGISQDEARTFIDEYFASYPEVRRCTEELVASAERTGCAVTLLGRRLPLPELRSSQAGRRAFAERVAVNAPIQGSAADLIKLAMVRLHARLRERGLRSRMILQVHDELLFEAPAAEVEMLSAIVRQEMEAVLPLAVPLVVDIGVGRDWAEAH